MESRSHTATSDENKVASDVASNDLSIPDFSNDTILASYKKFYETPILDVIKAYLQEKFDDEQFMIRMQYLTASEKKTVHEWATNDFEKFASKCESARTLFKTLVFALHLDFDKFEKNIEVKAGLKKAVEQGSVVAIALLGLVERNTDLKTVFFENAIKKSVKIAYYFLARLHWENSNFNAAYRWLNKGVNVNSVYALLGAGLFALEIEEQLSAFHIKQAFENLKSAASKGLPHALVVLAEYKFTGYSHYVSVNFEQSAYYYHYGLMRMKNAFGISIMSLGRDHVETAVENYPLELGLDSFDDLFSCYQLAHAINQIQGNESVITSKRALFKKYFNHLVKNDLETFEKLYLADEFVEGKQAALSWLTKPVLLMLWNKYNLAFAGLQSNFPDELSLYIMDFAIDKTLADFVKGDALSDKDKNVEKTAQIMLHFLQQAALARVHGFFKYANGVRVHSNKNLFAAVEKAKQGKTTYTEALGESTDIIKNKNKGPSIVR